MVNVEYAQGVRQEVDDAINYYERAQEGLGLAFLVEIERTLEKCTYNPKAYPCLRGSLRRCLTKKFPYAVIYSYDEDINRIFILAVMHTSRQPDYWASRK